MLDTYAESSTNLLILAGMSRYAKKFGDERPFDNESIEWVSKNIENKGLKDAFLRDPIKYSTAAFAELGSAVLDRIFEDLDCGNKGA